jgi:glutathione synthase/RimK-type ligase-like ATP-grasp enzyme
MCGNPEDAQEFYTRFISNEREYRLHIFNGELIRLQRKYLDYPDQQRSPYIKNYANGYRFRTPQRMLHGERIEQATNAVRALGLVWGAVDMVIGEDNLAYVLEVNTAPKLAPLTMQQYAQAIQTYLADEYGIRITPDYTALGRGIDE